MMNKEIEVWVKPEEIRNAIQSGHSFNVWVSQPNCSYQKTSIKWKEEEPEVTIKLCEFKDKLHQVFGHYNPKDRKELTEAIFGKRIYDNEEISK